MDKLVLVLGITVLTVALFKHFRLPSIIAYLLIGCFLGPYTLGILDSTEQIKWLAEIGVVFLLFTIGLELPLAKFMEMRYNLLLIGGSQVLLCTLTIGLLLFALGNSLLVSWAAASALSLSSTAIIMRQLSEQNELFARHGQLSFAILIFQDLAVVPLLILLPLLADFNNATTDSPFEVVWPIVNVLFKGAVVFAIIIALSRTILRKAFHKIALTRSLELFMFMVLFVTLLSAFVTHEFGLSMSFGAFIAGIGLGESEFRHQIEAEVRPFRDVLLGIFFISIGMLLDLKMVFDNFLLIIIAVIAIVLIKFLVVASLCYFMGKRVNLVTALKTGMIMAHAGEFGLAILTLATSYKIITGSKAQVLLASMIVSLFVAVLLTKYAGNILRFIIKIKLGQGYQNSEFYSEVAESNSPMASHYPDTREHIIICGFGRVGKMLSKFLKMENRPYLCLETDPRLVKNGVLGGYNVYYGDANRRDVLSLAGVSKAKLIAICLDDDETAKKIITHIKSLNDDVKILVRTRDLKNKDKFLQLGANEVIAETLEASMMLGLQMFMLLGSRPDDAMNYINKARQDKTMTIKFEQSESDSLG